MSFNEFFKKAFKIFLTLVIIYILYFSVTIISINIALIYNLDKVNFEMFLYLAETLLIVFCLLIGFLINKNNFVFFVFNGHEIIFLVILNFFICLLLFTLFYEPSDDIIFKLKDINVCFIPWFMYLSFLIGTVLRKRIYRWKSGISFSLLIFYWQ